ncbi:MULTISPECIES: hypothetical protein [Acinetobacter]|uniref:hypothetical protein n=1 Tax=Acinetobacter TaxID=469 RepID=UPI00028CFD4D|nr:MULTISPECIES: hypothetical protein [Acinetobacter]EKK13914.1 hypothetical protein ACIN5162_3652 [Acinetobacter baumannii OIFC0162]EKV6050507.1 hypothetical protein [Acinetobacter baumannii]ELY3910939.1 hypothetical protein [Acinetobacter baumannii]MBK0410702.1 hypothetical protein [Acinetobacter pittii]MBK1418592.1 hypothetical protein [Acinetobacter pittii]
MDIINSIKLIFISSLILISSGCSILKSEPQLTGSIESKNLLFSFNDEDIVILAYQVNSLEEFEKDGLTYKNILKYQNYEGFKKISIEDYKKKNIQDNHAYYLIVTKEGTILQTFGFCIKDKYVYLQKDKKDDQGFTNKCHSL